MRGLAIAVALAVTGTLVSAIAKRQVARGEPLLVFNPFPEWDGTLPIATLKDGFITTGDIVESR